MNFDQYQEEAAQHAFYRGPIPQLGVYPALGLAGEVGEVIELVKKFHRDGAASSPNADHTEYRAKLTKELGDVLWYLSQLARDNRISFEAIARANLLKLQSRKDRGVLGGRGSDR